MKQIELAIALGVAKSSVRHWCSNTVQPPIFKLGEIAKNLDCDIKDLLNSNNYPS